MNVRKDRLIDHDLIRSARVTNRIDRALTRGSVGRNPDIHRVHTDT
jgi:hypothetical protein